MLSVSDKSTIRQNINQNNQEIFILSFDEMDYVIQKSLKTVNSKTQWDKLKNRVEFAASYYASGGDVVLLGRLMSDLGYAGTQAYIKFYSGKPHIILKGRPGLRRILNGTKYGVKNVKVVKMGLGKYGAVKAAKSGGVLTIVLVTAYRVIDYFLTDSATLMQLIGTLATDVVKVGIATGAAIAAATGMAATGFLVAIGPIVAAIVIGVAVSWLLGELDQKYNVTEKVIDALDELSETIKASIQTQKQEIVNTGDKYVNSVAESVIDYAIDSAQQILINTAKHILRKFVTPQFR